MVVGDLGGLPNLAGWLGEDSWEGCPFRVDRVGRSGRLWVGHMGGGERGRAGFSWVRRRVDDSRLAGVMGLWNLKRMRPIGRLE